MIVVDIRILLDAGGPQPLLYVLWQINLVNKVFDPHRSLRIEQAAIQRRKLVLSELLHAGLGAVFFVHVGQPLTFLNALDSVIGLHHVIVKSEKPTAVATKDIARLLFHGVPPYIYDTDLYRIVKRNCANVATRRRPAIQTAKIHRTSALAAGYGYCGSCPCACRPRTRGLANARLIASR